MAIPTTQYAQAEVSGVFETKSANIELTPEMFELLSAGIYEDRILAIVRELSCNGRDAMIDFAQQRQIDVQSLPKMDIHIPTTFEPFFYVRDYGTGLTHKQVFEIYLSYGHSTKRESNSFVGMLGIGSKSPLAYADSFIVTSFVDGTQTQYNVYKDNGIPKITKLVSLPTTEANGLKVQVAVQSCDFWNFADRATKFFKLFDTEVQFTGNDISNRVSELTYIERNKLYEIAEGYTSGCYATMGGVPYRLSESIASELRKILPSKTLLLPFELGSLNIASSRENLSFIEGDKTDLALKERVQKVKDVYLKNIQAAVDKCETVYEAFKMLYDKYSLQQLGWSIKTYNYPSIVFKGKTLDEWSAHLKDDIKYETFIHSYGSTTRKTNFKDSDAFGCCSKSSREPSSVIIFNNDKPRGGIKCVRAYCLKHRGVRAIFNPSDEGREALKEMYGELKEITCSEIYDEYCPKVERQKQEGSKVRVSGVFKISEKDNYIGTREVTEIDNTETGYYLDMVRDTVTLEGKSSRKDISKLCLKFLVETGVLNGLYLIRKTAAKKNRPTGLVKLTAEKLEELVQTRLDKKTLKKAIEQKVWDVVPYLAFKGGFESIEDDILKGYPTLKWYIHLNRQQDFNVSLLLNGLASLGIGSDTEAYIAKHARRGIKRYNKEYDQLRKEQAFVFSMMDRLYLFDSKTKEELVAFVKAKLEGKL